MAQTRFCSRSVFSTQPAPAEFAFFHLRELVLRVRKKFHDQNGGARLRVQIKQVAHGLKLALAARLVEQWPVNVFDGRRLQVQQFLRRLHCLGHRIKKNQAHAAFSRQGHHFQFRRKNSRQRAFTAAENGNQISRLFRRAREAVARPAFRQTGGKTLGNLQRIQLTKSSTRLR